MKLLVVVLCLAACASARIVKDVSPRSPHGYLTKYGIPEAERIKKVEDEYLRSKSSRIIGGAPASDAQFPYLAGILADLQNYEGQAVCGGSLIKTDRILTAAHCWWDGTRQAWRFTVVLGSNLLFSGGERILTTDITTHPLWIPFFTFNDIAFARIPDVELSESIALIALPTELDIFENFRDQEAIVSGFGFKKDDDIFQEDQYLNFVNMTVIPNEECNVLHLGQIRSSHVCTRTTGGASTCTGDSGGPLAIIRNGEPLLIGVTSVNLALDCESGWPAVFTRVTYFLSFINSE